MLVRLLAGKYQRLAFFSILSSLIFLIIRIPSLISPFRGPGGVVPYRVYVNSSVIFLCVVALAPLCPMVAPFTMMYFIFITPLLKWGHIFVYRPTFDGGGMRWPQLHNILMISVIVSQVRVKITIKVMTFPTMFHYIFVLTKLCTILLYTLYSYRLSLRQTSS